MERYRNIDKAPRPHEVMLPHRSDGVGYALRRAYPAVSSNGNGFVDLLCTLDSVRVSDQSG